MKSIGIDIGEVSFNAVWLDKEKKIKGIFRQEHEGRFMEMWEELKEKWEISFDDRVVTTGALRDSLAFLSVPEMVAQKKALLFLYPKEDITLVRLAGAGFSFLKNRNGKNEYRKNPECAAGTGTFLEQNLSRFGLSMSDADQIINGVEGLKFSGRCAVFLKTEATHAVNAGSQKKEAIAGLFDATARNAVALIEKSALTAKTFLIGGLSQSKRIQEMLQKELPGTKVEVPLQALLWEAFGAALIGMEEKLPPVKKAREIKPLVWLPPLKNFLSQVTKLTSSEVVISGLENLTLGLDVGSTGSKAAIVSDKLIYEDYCETKGDPVEAAKTLIGHLPKFFLENIKVAGVTGSGREIVGPLFISLFGEQVFVLNEIAAHARGAVYYDAEVDTIIDIGGQDSKYARLQNGLLIDSAMNTVCSAGTGSFLTEQLQLLGISDVKEMGKIALQAPRAPDLGEHCAVFIAKQISQAQQKGATTPEIAAGLYYSIAKNYVNRVIGSRQFGKKIFLQGKPAENLALALALAKVSDQKIAVPASPGIMGALGIALLAKQEVKNLEKYSNLNLGKFLASKVISKSEFICHSKDGCEKGNQCKVKVLKVELEGKDFKSFWDDRCGKYQEIKKSNVLTRAPQPFLERENLIQKLIIKDHPFSTKTVAIPRGLETEEILPLAIIFLQNLGLKVKLLDQSGLATLEKGTKLCQSDFCAPLQCIAGQAKELEAEDFIFLPKVIEIESQKQEERCYVCPLSQAMPDMLRPKLSGKILAPFLNFKKGYDTRENRKEFIKMWWKLGIEPLEIWWAFKKAVKAQREFENEYRKIGKEAVDFGEKYRIPVIVVEGHLYLIHSKVLNSGVPEIIMEKGAIALPADCYPLKGIAPKLDNIYWGYGHRLLDVAFEVRRKAGVFGLYLSTFECGIDSFIEHFFQYLSEGKPYSLLVTDALTGKAGFGTRVEAFLYGVHNYQQPENEQNLPDLSRFETKGEALSQVEGKKVLFPWMGEGSILAPALVKAGLGIEADYLPMADEIALELGRKYTSGKECLPMIVTLGNLLKYLKAHPDGKYAYFMPWAGGPCRFGQYQVLTKIILEKLGLSEKVVVISPNSETGYRLNQEFGPAMTAKSWATFVLVDLLKDALHEVRPFESEDASISEIIFNECFKIAKSHINASPNDWSGYKNLWGMKDLATIAAEAFKRIKLRQEIEEKPRVLVTGEIFVRLDEFSNNHIVKELEALGAKVKLAPFREWINYTTFQRRKRLTVVKQKRWKVYLNWFVQRRIESQLYQIFAKELDWPKDHSIDAILKVAAPYLTKLRPLGETALTVGLSLLLWQKKETDGVVMAGPFGCMPSRTAEEISSGASEKNGLRFLSLPFHGNPTDRDVLESFVWGLRTNE